MKKLKREGATLTSFLQYAMRAYVEGRISLGIIPHEPQWTSQLEEEYQATIAKKSDFVDWEVLLEDKEDVSA